MARKSAVPHISVAIVPNRDNNAVIARACSATPQASSRRPAPSARAMPDAAPAPMPPDTTVITVNEIGKTSDTAAIASSPSRLTK